MSRGPRQVRTLSDAIPIAHVRGHVQMTATGPEQLYDFTIASSFPVAFVTAKYAPRIFATLAEIVAEFQEAIARLRSVTQDAAISRELWLRSKHGTWRFFRIMADHLVELGRDGKPLPG